MRILNNSFRSLKVAFFNFFPTIIENSHCVGARIMATNFTYITLFQYKLKRENIARCEIICFLTHLLMHRETHAVSSFFIATSCIKLIVKINVPKSLIFRSPDSSAIINIKKLTSRKIKRKVFVKIM